MAMNLSEIDLSNINWDFNEAWSWPEPVKIGVIVFSCLCVMGGGIYYDTLPQLQELEVLEKKETELKSVFETKNAQAASLSAYQTQLVDIKKILERMIKQMPLKEEVAGLLNDISQTGLSNGLEFKLFKPAPEIKKDFYSELPINMEVVGKYEELLKFISGIASLPRIVTIHDTTITPIDKTKTTKQNMMLMSILVKTYHENANDSESTANKTKNNANGSATNAKKKTPSNAKK